jgi:hypothetical protein
MSPTWRKFPRDGHHPDSANWENKKTGSSTPALRPVSSTALGGDTKPPKSRSKSGGYLKTQKYTLPNNQPSFILPKTRQMTTPPQISGDITRFSLKEFSKVRPSEGGRGLATSKQEKTLPRQPAFLFFWRKIDSASKMFSRNFPFFSNRIHQSSPFLSGACRHKYVYWATVLMIVYNCVAS